MYKKKLLIALMVLLGIFLIVFIAAIMALNRNAALFSIPGLPVIAENWIVIILSIISMFRIVWEIVLVEEHKK
jgi:hypothetical protein